MKRTITMCALALGLTTVGCERGMEPIEGDPGVVGGDETWEQTDESWEETQRKPDEPSTELYDPSVVGGLGTDERIEAYGLEQGGDDPLVAPGAADVDRMGTGETGTLDRMGTGETGTVDPMGTGGTEGTRLEGTEPGARGTGGPTGSMGTGGTVGTGTGTLGGEDDDQLAPGDLRRDDFGTGTDRTGTGTGGTTGAGGTGTGGTGGGGF